MTPKLSVVTGTYNRPREFRRMVDSVLRHTATEFEIVVSDASKTPEPYDHPAVRTLIEQPRLGHSKGYNAAFRQCRGEWIIWLNDDAEVTAGYDTAAIAFMESHPRIGLGALHYSENGGDFHVNESWKVLYANFGIFRKSVGEQVGFFDEEIRMYGADNSFAFRVLLADYGIADIPDARILHHSEKDSVRYDNQIGRLRDNQTLSRKYMPLRAQWTAAYNRHKVPSTTVPWAHGVKPQTVTA